MEFSGIGLYRHRFDGTVMYADRGAVKIFELEDMFPDPSAVAGNNISDLFIYTGPVGLLREKIRKHGRVHNLEYPFKTLKGREKWVLHDSYLDRDPKTGEEAIQAVIRDITERKKSEEALRKAEHEKELIFDSLMEHVVFQDNTSKIIWANRAACESLGLSLDELIGRHCYELWASRNDLCPDCPVAKAIETGEPQEIEKFTPDGRAWFIRGYPIANESSDIVGGVELTLEITERKAAEEKLRMLQMAVEQSIDGIAVADMGGIIQFVNEAWAQMHGLSVTEPLGRHLSIFHTDEQMQGDVIPFNEQVKNKGAHQGEVGHVKRDGTTFPTWMTTTILKDEENNPIGLIGIARDITDRMKRAEEKEKLIAAKAAEEKTRAIIDAIPDSVCIVDLDLNVVDVNKAMEDLFESPREKLLSLTAYDLTTEADMAGALKAVEDLLKTGAQQTLELTGAFGKAKGRPFWMTMALLDEGKGEPTAIVTATRDITERKRLEDKLAQHVDELKRVNRKLADANNELEAFVYSVSHDLRAPLRAMEGFSQALLQDYAKELDPAGRDFARRIVAAARRMDKLIQDLLDYSHLGKSDMYMRSVYLDVTVREVQMRLEAEIREKKARITIEEQLPLVIAHNATLLRVLENLLSNAIKFVGPGTHPRVRIRAEERNGCVRLWVEDNGIGIAPEHHERIFRIFERLHGIEAYPGTGIGLAIVRRAVERMGGRVGLESAPGQGSKFWVELEKAEGKS
jgi:PAS domain S-box-containing protein